MRKIDNNEKEEYNELFISSVEFTMYIYLINLQWRKYINQGSKQKVTQCK